MTLRSPCDPGSAREARIDAQDVVRTLRLAGAPETARAFAETSTLLAPDDSVLLAEAGALAHAQGQHEVAGLWRAAAVRSAKRLGNAVSVADVLVRCGRAAALQDPDLVQRLFRVAHRHALRPGCHEQAGEASLALGILRNALGHEEEATGHFARAVGCFGRRSPRLVQAGLVIAGSWLAQGGCTLPPCSAGF
jgi:hypothetical protein